jgi:predicted RecB family nuclease
LQQLSSGEVLYSASDLVNFLECEHLTTLDLIDLKTPLPKTESSDDAKLIQAKGFAHEGRYFDELKAQCASVVDLTQIQGGLAQKAAATLDAMRAGAEVIYQATLRDGPYIGHADFLRRVPRSSKLGPYGYEVVDTKLSRSTKAKFVIQLAFYSNLLAKAQGSAPHLMHVRLGDQREEVFPFADYARYFAGLAERFLERVGGDSVPTYPDPCERCDLCKYRELCEDRRTKDDHLCQVANITKLQTKRLQAAGIPTLESLANISVGTRVPKVVEETLARLRHQASLQLRTRLTGERCHDLLPVDAEGIRGFARLPRSDPGDLFFDMEGDPFEDGGLEYLFGLYFFDDGEPQFKAFWAHSRAEERRAFAEFMDFATARLRAFPGAHIYHYAHYERTALEKLMSLHGTREAEVDNLFRAAKLVDLYKVVREGLRVSEPRYSIKNIEHFYMQDRAGEVKSAGASIVYYERWKETGEAQLLEDIEAYNFDDVRSTYELRQWLISLRPVDLPWANERGEPANQSTPEVGALTEAEQRLVPYRQRLVDSLPADRSTRGRSEHLRELAYQLLDFHRRCAKPEWWAIFARAEMTEDELIDDAECLGGAVLDAEEPPVTVRKSLLYTYRYPEQETKLKTGDHAVAVHSLAPLNGLQVDEDNRRVRFTYAAGRDPLPARLSIGPGRPISAGALVDAIFRFADSIIGGTHNYAAIESVLAQEVPRIKGLESGRPVLDGTADVVAQAIERVVALDNSHLFIQGPPGAGKTYTGSHVIVSLLERGYRVGVTSNSHKAINNLLACVERVAEERGIHFKGAKKSTAGAPDSELGGRFIADLFANSDVLAGGFDLIAGTAWLFADPAFDQALDYLFVDEAGQVALANLVAVGTSARNIVLLGDQMQLGQPIKGVHPGRSGESSLDYLLSGIATIPPDRGIFLNTTWRMHPDVCRFISDAVYDSRLEPEPRNATQTLLLGADAHPALRPTGVQYLPIAHDGCSQRSDEEAELIRALYANLLRQRYRDKHGEEHNITPDNILVVAPYNMQVNRLKQVLSEGARVGTVDKFQGQEAEVVLISMTTSSGDYLPRHLDFLFSKNRLNVAISRAKCLALLIANPSLLSIRCSKPEEMALVNTLCWVQDYSRMTALVDRVS